MLAALSTSFSQLSQKKQLVLMARLPCIKTHRSLRCFATSEIPAKREHFAEEMSKKRGA